MQARTIGLMTMIDNDKKDHKILAVATHDPEYDLVQGGERAPYHRLAMLRRFFQDYKQLEGKAVEVDEIQDSHPSIPIIEDGLQAYSERRRRGLLTKH